MKNRTKGFSLIELLVAMGIGVFLLGGLFAAYLESQNTRRTADTLARMQEQGRYAMMFLTRELQRAGYWGQTTHEGTIVGQNGNSPLSITIGNDCGTSPSWALQLAREVEASNDTNPYNATCLDDADHLDNTDVLVIRSTSPETWTDTDIADDGIGGAGKLFIRSDVTHGELYEGGTTTPPAAAGFLDHEDHRYNAAVYYVRPWAYEENPSDNLPVLRRLVLADGGSDPAVQNENGEIAAGVEDFQVQFGVVDNNGTRFVNPGDASIASDMSNIVSLRVWLLLRAENPETGYENNTTYVYADKSVTVDDNIRRMLFTKTIQLRNLAE